MDLGHRAVSSKKRLDFVLCTFLMPLAWFSSPVAACWRHRESAFVTLTSAVKHSDHVDCTHPPNPTHITFANVVAACPFVVRPKLVLSKDLQGSTVRVVEHGATRLLAKLLAWVAAPLRSWTGFRSSQILSSASVALQALASAGYAS